jgi:4a-hydroxytetrahydrobiopterin dehydratase
MEWNGTKESINREFVFGGFKQAVAFVNKVADAAELNDHHPDILLHGYKRVTITLTTHDQGKVTLKDLKLAEIIDEIYDLELNT